MAEAAVHSNRYPQYDNVLLRERLAALYGFSTEEVVCGNGASELFVAIVHALRPKRVGILAPSFSGYAWAAQTVGARYAVFRCGKKIILPWTWHRWSHCAGIWMESAHYFWRIQRIRRETKWKRLFWRRFLTCVKRNRLLWCWTNVSLHSRGRKDMFPGSGISASDCRAGIYKDLCDSGNPAGVSAGAERYL